MTAFAVKISQGAAFAALFFFCSALALRFCAFPFKNVFLRQTSFFNFLIPYDIEWKQMTKRQVFRGGVANNAAHRSASLCKLFTT